MDVQKTGQKVADIFKAEFNEEKFIERIANEVLFPELEALAASTPNKLDDVALGLVKEVILKALAK